MRKKIDEIRNLYNRRISYYKSLPSFGEVIEYASKGIHLNKYDTEVMDRHQCRVGYENCDLGAKELLTREGDIKKADSFEEIHAITEEVRKDSKTNRLGELWSYDTALRIGFSKDVYPKHVYLHAGTREGAINVLGKEIANKNKLEKEVFPKEFQVMKCYEIEAFLCIHCKDHKSLSCIDGNSHPCL